MPKLNSTIPVAYLNIRGANMVVVFFESEFDARTPHERNATYTAVQAAAAFQGFEGEVVALWEDRLGRTRFIAPPQQHPFFQVVNYHQLRAQVNGTVQA
jgi:hypothetical protein